ncbi:hypothetical protein RF11_02692 [Thelohanellus kitauei]|uniref:Uncharacterized protein n=1 Tax=Thelohanellus kitauei TaxID=669202 RepID=A0A0C2MUB4_THEKT|nr:hypothetical protein RF11_02692 [Thelohanellus kitauei]
MVIDYVIRSFPKCHEAEVSDTLINLLRYPAFIDIFNEAKVIKNIVKEFQKTEIYKNVRYEQYVKSSTINHIIKHYHNQINGFCLFIQLYLQEYVVVRVQKFREVNRYVKSVSMYHF